MKQKIVIRLQLDDDKCRSKALKMAAEAQGVSSVSLEGEERNQLVVTGFVDSVCLASVLRKKFRCVTLVSVEEVKKEDQDDGGKKDRDEGDKKDKDDDENEKQEMCYCSIPCRPLPPPCVPCPTYHVVYDQYPNNCSIL